MTNTKDEDDKDLRYRRGDRALIAALGDLEVWLASLPTENKWLDVWDVLGIEPPSLEKLPEAEQKAIRHPMVLEAERHGFLQRHVVTCREPPVFWTRL